MCCFSVYGVQLWSFAILSSYFAACNRTASANCCQLVHGAAVFAVRCISARWSAIQASQAVDVDGSRAKLTKLHCYNMLQQLASPTNEAQFFLENCEAMRIFWPWHDRHDIA